MIEKEGSRHYVLIKDFNSFMYYHTLHRGRKHFFRYCLQAFRTEEILNFMLKIVLKLMVNKGLRWLRNVKTLDSKIMRVT